MPLFVIKMTAWSALILSSISASSTFASDYSGSTTAECLAEAACQETVLNRIETRMGGLDYSAGYPTDETVSRLYDEMDYQRAVLAHQMVIPPETKGMWK
ncbi:hypothetical protein [Parasedimentitalea psychrophila]|uniref:DUF4148 domain-containing protein n=1 Tax=Parasedimentitalea psychrophila TaxID=2997337 RepID=A0A9Y2P282_9RHOB|nr:hypothetical protein [Parasedimentitalea psychrophila]WIY24812.1 hypothetical protein QPJ95_20295 [Parasedimentitalea psychrophila]